MSYKAVEIAAELADELKKRVTGLKLAESADASGNPVITLSDGTPAAGEKVIVIRVGAIDWPLAKDVLGLTAMHFTPHTISICTEANFAGTTDNIADILTPAELLPVLAAVCKRGTRVEWYVSDNGTLPAVAQMVAAKLKASYEAELFWGMQASQ